MKLSNVALLGLGRAEALLNRTAERMARVSTSAESTDPKDSVSLSEEMINLMRARTLHQANVKSLETANQMEKSVLDILA